VIWIVYTYVWSEVCNEGNLRCGIVQISLDEAKETVEMLGEQYI